MKQKERQQEIAKLQDFAGIFMEMARETDRGAALLAGALLDNCLAALLEAFLVAEHPPRKNAPRELDKLLHEPNAPLGTFSARARATYCLGLISHSQFCDIGVIREIRNRFAHQLHGYSFETPTIQSSCNKLLVAKQVAEFVGDSESVGARARFGWSVSILFRQLTTDAFELAAREQRVERPSVALRILSE